jgi:mRNA interferase MazF
VDFDRQVGREQRGTRPAIVVGTPLACRAPNGLAIVLPTTSTNRGLPTQPPVRIGAQTSWAMTDQIKAVSYERFSRRVSAGLDPDEITEIKFALRQMIDVT